MKYLKTLLVATLLLALNTQAQTNVASYPIKGNLKIRYNSRTTPGSPDVYDLTVSVANSAQFSGKITDTPLVMGGILGNTEKQPRSLYYDINCDVVNPNNPAQTRNVGRLFGKVPIDQSGVYQYDAGSLQVSVLPLGNSGGFDSKFSGTTVGKPLVRPKNWFENLQSTLSPVNITRTINGKTTSVVLKKYDKMEFKNHTIGAGPVGIYQQLIVSGEALYDYDKKCWFFNNFIIQSPYGLDRVAGNIRWYDAKGSTDGYYDFDVRVNEPPPTESAAFGAPADESAFFETNTRVPSVTGTMKYKDLVKAGITQSSDVTIDLVGNHLTKPQVMAIAKVVIFSMVVPMNAD